MKQIVKIILQLFAFVLSSCLSVDEPSVRTFPVRTETIVQVTKVSVNGTQLSWEDDDVLQLVAISENGEVGDALLQIYEKEGRNASFTGYVTMDNVPQSCIFTYPASLAMQVVPENRKVNVDYSIQNGSHKPFLYAQTSYNSTSINTVLRHVGAVLELDISIPGVRKVTFKGNNNEHLFPLILDPSTGEITHSNISGSSITVPVQTSGKTYINVPPVDLTRGFALILETEDESLMYKSYSSDGTVNGGYDFTQAVGKIIPITLSGDFKKFGVSLKSFSVSHTEKDNLLNGTRVALEMEKTGVSDKLIEQWGARLTMGGTVVRSILCTDKLLSDGEVVLDEQNDYSLLPAGDYQLTPFYRAFGQDVSLPSISVTVPDPGVVLQTTGITSYDVYKSNGAEKANEHTNTLISGLSATINVHPDILDSFTMTFPAATSDSKYELSGTTSNVLNPGEFHRKTFTTHTMTVTAKVGVINVSATKDFVITGLPYSASFESNNFLTDWYESSNVQLDKTAGRYVLPNKTESWIVSPEFYLPSGIASLNATSVLNTFLYTGTAVSSLDATVYVGLTNKDSSPVKNSGGNKFTGSGLLIGSGAPFEDVSNDLTLSTTHRKISVYANPSNQTFLVTGVYTRGFILQYFKLNYR